MREPKEMQQIYLHIQRAKAFVFTTPTNGTRARMTTDKQRRTSDGKDVSTGQMQQRFLVQSHGHEVRKSKKLHMVLTLQLRCYQFSLTILAFSSMNFPSLYLCDVS